MPYGANYARTTGLAPLAAALFLAGAVMTEAQAGNGGRQTHMQDKARAAAGRARRLCSAHPAGTRRARQDKWQSQDGRSASRQVDVTHDPASGTRNRAAGMDRSEGRTTTVDTVTQRTGSGYTRDTTANRDDGRTATRKHRTVAANDRAAGSRSVDSTTTGFDGPHHCVLERRAAHQ